MADPTNNPPENYPADKTVVETSNRAGSDSSQTVVDKGFPFQIGAQADLESHPSPVHLQGFEVVRQFEARGGEADIYMVRQGEGFAILKLYRFGINPKLEILQKMVTICRDYPAGFVQIQYFGYHPETRRFFELQEYITEGALNELLQAQPFDEPKVRLFLEQLEKILSVLHDNDILHLDLKPANILVRHSEPLELVLTDFGIASILEGHFSKKFTEVKGTSLYQSPESIAGIVSRKSDWWSLGIIILELLTGRNPFEKLNRQVVFYHLTTKGVPIPETVVDPWRTILRGLLTRNPDHRWAGNEVKRWLAGENVPVVPDEGLNLEDGLQPEANENRNKVPFQFLSSDYFRLGDLLEAFTLSLDAWTQARLQIAKGYLLKWLEEIHDFEKAGRLSEIIEKEPNVDIALFRIIFSVRKDLPISWYGETIDEQRIVRALAGAIKDNLSEKDRVFIEAFLLHDLGRIYESHTEKPPHEGEKYYRLTTALRGTALNEQPLKEKAKAMVLMANEAFFGKKPMSTLGDAFHGNAECLAMMRIASLPGFIDFAMKAGTFNYQETMVWRLACSLLDREKELKPRVKQVLTRYADGISNSIVSDGSVTEIIFQVIGKNKLKEETIRSVQLQRIECPWLLELVRTACDLDDYQDVGKFLELNILHFRAIEKRDAFGKLVQPKFIKDILVGADVPHSFAYLIKNVVEKPQILLEKGKYRGTDETGKIFLIQNWSDVELALKTEGFQNVDCSTPESLIILKEIFELRNKLIPIREKIAQKSEGNIWLTIFLIIFLGLLFSSDPRFLIPWTLFGVLFYMNRSGIEDQPVLLPLEEEYKKAKIRLQEEFSRPRRLFRAKSK